MIKKRLLEVFAMATAFSPVIEQSKPTSGRLRGKQLPNKKWNHRKSKMKMQKRSRKINRPK